MSHKCHLSGEESCIAIQRYLNDKREPYVAGLHGNTKRKIHKAALEVGLQAERQNKLIDHVYISSGGEHLNLQLTWETISPKILDYIRECQCQNKQDRGRVCTEEGLGCLPQRRSTQMQHQLPLSRGSLDNGPCLRFEPSALPSTPPAPAP
uniref:Uncharacterized protein n=1 Tax=Electrophorus electricus TaxID=8005 RepID=A0A4W4EXP7_ELEEL